MFFFEMYMYIYIYVYMYIYIYIYIFEWGGRGSPHSHSEARGARLHYKHFQINGFQSQLAYFFLQNPTFLENPSSRQIAIKKSSYLRWLLIFMLTHNCETNGYQAGSCAKSCTRAFSISKVTYADANFSIKLQQRKSMDFPQAHVRIFRPFFFQFQK